MGISAETKSSSLDLRELLAGRTPPLCNPLALSIQPQGSIDVTLHRGEGDRGSLCSGRPHQKRENETMCVEGVTLGADEAVWCRWPEVS